MFRRHVSCKNIVIHDLEAPPPGSGLRCQVATFPSWVITVSIPLDPDDARSVEHRSGLPIRISSEEREKRPRHDQGGGDASGKVVVSNQINLSAGGTNRSMIDAKS